MTRKKFIKELMSAGISRNTATAAADAASRAEIPLTKCAGRILNMQRIFAAPMSPVKQWRKAFDQALKTQAERTPRRIRPLSKKSRQDGLRIDFAAVDEWGSMQVMSKADHEALHGAARRLGKIYQVSLVAAGGYPLGGTAHE